MRAPGVFLLAMCCASAQESRPATRPAPFDSDAALHSVAASVMPSRIAKRLEEMRAPGSRTEPSDSEIPTTAPGGRRVILTALTTEPVAVAALLETGRVIEAQRKGGDLADPGFDLRFECVATRPTSRPAAPALVAEIHFGSLAKTNGPALRATLAAPEPMRKEAAGRLERLFGRVKGEKGFWPEFEVVVDTRPAPKNCALVVTIDANGAKPAGRESASETDCRAAVRAARCALMIVAQLAEELRAR